mgnify:CR=1 FL=1
MSELIRVGIVGYGNLGQGVERALTASPDMRLVGVFSRRDPASVTTLIESVPVHSMEDLDSFDGALDLLILCGGSRDDLPVQSPTLASKFNIIDSFDTHARIPEHFAAVDKAALATQHTALIAVGWDPGLFSLNRLFGEAILPQGDTYTFWGRGLSQGHSDAIRRVAGVKGGVQYTVPAEEAIERVRSGQRPVLSTREKHQRVCYVVLEDGASPDQVAGEIRNMPDYFADYDTSVNFISQQELHRDHAAMPHGGFVLRSGETGEGNRQLIEYRLDLDSNPEFTASVLVAYGRATYRMNQRGEFGAKTVFDVPPGLLSTKSMEQLRKELL